MKPMRPFLLTLALVWTAASMAAFLYSQQQNIPSALLSALLPAFLLEIGFYLVTGFEWARRAFDSLGPKPVRAFLLLSSAVAPYLIESSRTGSFSLRSFLMLTALAAMASFWYVILPASLGMDLLFLCLLAAVSLTRIFAEIYVRPTPGLQLEILGRLMWIRLSIMAILSVRGLAGARVGFLPNAKEWRVGIEQFVYFLAVGGAVAYFLRFANFRPVPLAWWKFALFVPGTFLAILWVVALSEEFFFRGFLQPLLARGFGSETAGLIVASALFGSVHLWFRKFPNWRFAVVAAVAGLFYGIAYRRARSIRASMVTHALVVTAWKSLFA